MRSDALGFFWQDRAKERTQLKVERGPLPVPDTGWEMPKDFPRLEAAKLISIDVETHDPDLKTKGPGMRRDGYMCGLAVGAEDRDGHIKTWYFPFGHVEGENMSESSVLAWAKDNLSGDQPKIGANILYDIMYLDHAGVTIGGKWHDVLMADSLLDENELSYTLDAVSGRRLQEQKKKNALKTWLEGSFRGEWAGNIWRAPTSLVAPYAEMDAELPLKLYRAQKPLLEAEDLDRVYDLECRLLPILLAMSKQGVRVDLDRAEALNSELERRIKRDSEALGGINVDAPSEIAPVFDKLGLGYPRTPKTKEPSFTKAFLENHEHPIAGQIMDLRKWKKFKSTFIEGYILGKHVNNKVYPSFNPRGARTGRFSSSRPNLQNIPSRDPELGPMVRSLFIPEPGESWYKLDYSQIEYRYLVHMGNGEVAEILKNRYRNNPKTDIHYEVTTMLNEAAALEIDRSAGKNINFSIVYGKGIKALANTLGMDIDATTQLRNEYYRLFPFAKDLSDRATRLAGNRGYIRTMLGRRRRFDDWEPKSWDDKRKPIRGRDKAIAEYGQRIKRAHTHKALNARIQGTAADIMKKAMVDVWESGLCKEVVPMLTVHDELDFSTTNEKAIMQVREIMEQSTQISIPLLIDVEKGKNWGEVKSI